MSDYFQIDVLHVATDSGTQSGDAIPLRYQLGGTTYLHVVDGGYVDTGPEVVSHIKKWYDSPRHIDHVVVTHPDGDHANGLRAVLEETSWKVRALWMLRPWEYAHELIHRFAKFTSVDNLRRRLREIYPNLVALEEIAQRRGIPILEPIQGVAIGAFRVLAPSKPRYLDLIVESEKTPESARATTTAFSMTEAVFGALAAAVRLVKSLWGAENLPPKETSAENEMSVVQFARLCGEDIVLTGDAGQHALSEAADFAPLVGLELPGVNRMQVPHHGSRRNVHSELLDRWLGLKRETITNEYTAVISAAKDDPDHPRKSVVRGFIHRGAQVIATDTHGETICMKSPNAPDRGWGAATILDYPQEEEAD